MMRAMYSGVSGLRVHQTKMDVISNNIANINTVGFKRSTVSFKDSFNQTLNSATAASGERGGTNPQQVGMGANVGAVATIMGQGAAQRTDYGSDLMIDGKGFFIVKDATGYSFTRAGAFEVDASGNLVDPNGFNVCGWKTGADGKIVQEKVTPINIYEGDNLYSPAKTSTDIEFSGNLNLANNGGVQNNTLSFYDSLGNKFSVSVEFRYDAATQNWTFSALPAGNPTATMSSGEVFTLQGFPAAGTTIRFGADGKIESVNNVNTAPFAMNFTPVLVAQAGPPVGPNPPNSTLGSTDLVNRGTIIVDFAKMTQFNSKSSVTANANGNSAGNMQGYSIDANGIVRGVYDNGESKILAQIAVADFKNPGGLEKYGSSLYKETANSSEFDGVGVAVGTLGSKLQSGALEMSNVDISYEFSEMIVTQRGFQASSRLITTSDEMIQELVNLKR